MANEVELCNKSCLEVMKEIPNNIKDTIITDQIFFHQKECIKKLQQVEEISIIDIPQGIGKHHLNL